MYINKRFLLMYMERANTYLSHLKTLVNINAFILWYRLHGIFEYVLQLQSTSRIFSIFYNCKVQK